jgi:Mg2+ and Co2+ transporter CorA
MAEKEQSNMAWLEEKGRLEEQPFTSSVPLFGPLIVWIRSAWNGVAAKWVVRQIMQQQNDFNALIVQQMNNFESQILEQVIEQDREQTALIREMGELSVQLNQMNRLLEAIDGRLAGLEEEVGVDGELEEE